MSNKKILIICPSTNKPVGGIRVLYRYCDLLNNNGQNAYILHTVKNFRCTWFPNKTKIYNKKLINSQDHLIFPETEIILNIEKLKNIINKYSIFVQNGYFIPDYINNHEQYLDFQKIYTKASFIIAISEDTKKMISKFFPIQTKNIIIANYSMEISNTLSNQNTTKKNIITYMPRKNYKHAQKVITGLFNQLPYSWKIIPIYNMNSNQVGALLNSSKIFLSFESFGGKPLPPIEAAISGNYVIGYHGQGGKKYWNENIFTEIAPYDIGSFIDSIINKVNEISSKSFNTDAENKNFKDFKKNILKEFSNENENISVAQIIKKIDINIINKNKNIRNIFQKNKVLNIFNNLLIMRKYNKKNSIKYLKTK